MSARFWNRRASVTAYSVAQGQSLTWNDLSLSFNASQGSQASPATVSLRNLAPSSREFLNLPDVRIALRAGYDDDAAISGGVLPLIIDSDVVRVEHRPPPLGWESTVTLAQGWHARNQRLSASFSGSSLATVASRLADVIAEGGVEVGDFKAALAGTQWSTVLPNRIVDGPALDSLSTLVRGTGYEIQIVDRRLLLVPPDDQVEGNVVLISPQTGLMGSPEPEWTERVGRRTPGSLKVQCRLTPSLRPGQTIMLSSALYSGQYTAFAVTHVGDTHAAPWDTTLRVRRVNAGTP